MTQCPQTHDVPALPQPLECSLNFMFGIIVIAVLLFQTCFCMSLLVL